MKSEKLKRLAVSAIMVALASVLSLIKVWQMPLGGSVTLLSMLPIVLVSVVYGVKQGLATSFVYAVIQLFFGITMDGLLGWGLTPIMLVGTIMLDYIIAFTVLGLAGFVAKKGYLGICLGTAFAICLRFVSHFISGVVIFRQLDQFELFGNLFENSPALYSAAYNGLFMLPELVLTLAAVIILFKLPQTKKLIAKYGA